MTAARRLAATFAVDVVGTSRLMGENEAGTARAVRERRDDRAHRAWQVFPTKLHDSLCQRSNVSAQSHRPLWRTVTTSIRPCGGPTQPDMTQLVRLTTIAVKTAGQKPATTKPERK